MKIAGSTCLTVIATLAAAAFAAEGLDLAGMDRSVVPGNNFYAYANGAWLAATEIPPDRSSYGIDDVIGERTDIQIASLIQKAAQTTAPAGSDLKLVGDYYAAYMDQDGIEVRGLGPLYDLRTEIQAISDRHELARFLGETLRADVDALNATSVSTDNLFGLWIAQDFDQPERYVPFLLQGGLGMPDRSYYLDSSPAMAEIQAKYTAHV